MLSGIDGTTKVIPGLTLTHNYHLAAALDGRIGNHVHFVWHEFDSNYDHKDMYYWRSDMTEAINITDDSVAIVDPEDVRVVVDETDTVHILWEESGKHYYNSASNNTIQLPALLDDVPVGYGKMVARDGVAYALFDFLQDSPFYIWQSDSNSVTTINHSLGSTAAAINKVANNEATSPYIWLDSLNQLHLLTDSLLHWDAFNGVQDFTADPEIHPSMGPSDYLLTAQDESGGSYVIWSGEETDESHTELFVAYNIAIDLSENLYLPFITR